MAADDKTLERIIKAVLPALCGEDYVEEEADSVARHVVEEWSKKPTAVLSRLDYPPLDGTAASLARRKRTEFFVFQVLKRDLLLESFTKDHLVALERFWEVGTPGNKKEKSIQITYDGIVDTVNSMNSKPVLKYPRVHKGMDASQVAAVKKERLMTEDAIKIWWRQMHQPLKKRLPEFTNNEAWLEILHHWSGKRSYMIGGCRITPELAPDCYWKFQHMDKLQREYTNGYWGQCVGKQHLEYCPLLEHWPKNYREFCRELKYVVDEQEQESQSEEEGEFKSDSVWGTRYKW